MLKRCEGETTRRSTKERATQKTEWLFRGLKSVLQHIFGQCYSFFWGLILTGFFTYMSELIKDNIV